MGGISQGIVTKSSNPTLSSSHDAFRCSLPAIDERSAASFLEGIGAGGIGAGIAMNNIGVNAPKIRGEYQRHLNELLATIESMKADGKSASEIAEFAVNKRLEIVRKIRGMSGVGYKVIFEVRDWKHYGVGGRTYSNVHRKVRNKYPDNINGELIAGATRSDKTVSEAAIKGARFLKHGGRLIFVVSLGATAHTIMTAPKEELERIIYQEVGAMSGGFAGGSLGAGLCLIFGVSTGGWGLLACGVIGGAAGAVGGSYAGEQIYYSMQPEENKLENGTLPLGGLKRQPHNCGSVNIHD